MERVLPEKDLSLLREQNLITEKETAYLSGSQIIAEDLITRTRRIVEVGGLLLESRRVLLKG
tara:strand:- start:1027 stop:1212 length:186 start_codon:yes stop_codon:yes gene_type:complete